MDRVEDGGRGRYQRGLADSLRAVGTERLGVFHEQALDLRHVADGGEQVVVEVLGAARHVLLHEGEPDALRDPALDLSFDEGRVDGGPHVVGGDDAPRRHGAELQVDLHAGNLGGEAVGRVRDPLTVLVERGAGRVEEPPAFQNDVVVRDDRQAPERDGVLDAVAVGDVQPRAVQPDARVRAGVDERQDPRAQIGAGKLGRAPGDERLARSRRFPRVPR